MTKKIFRSIMLVAAAVLLACLALVAGALYEYFSDMRSSQLASQLELAAKGVESGGTEYLASLDTEAFRATLIDAEGNVLYDTEADPATMENHADREEIKQALESGEGKSERFSSTLSQKTFYLARRLADGNVLRLSISQYSLLMLSVGMAQPLAIVILAAALLAFILANRLSKRIVEPLEAIDLDRPLENDTYEELAPLLTRMERQHRLIDEQLCELRRRNNEFSAVTESMSEGLVLLDDSGAVLSMNPAARRAFNAEKCREGDAFLTYERSVAVTNALNDARRLGRGEADIERGGREYRLNATSVASTGGAVLLVFDITDKAFAERNRREFTANVSHELKTPLQSIMGSAELIENGLAKPEDIKDFAGRIRAEAERLVTLINDIIRLSQLDEGGELASEETDLLELAQEAASSLAGAAQTKGVSIAVEGESARVVCAKRLMQEVIFNLCDNAIKYNREGGSVNITVARDGENAPLTVSDTGIGIPAEDEERVFERFYRVDKSRSKETGGTGLGLSIVKHAVKYMGGRIDLHSKLGEGTAITITVPIK